MISSPRIPLASSLFLISRLCLDIAWLYYIITQHCCQPLFYALAIFFIDLRLLLCYSNCERR
nr:MAG TPA: hypothetical protein [Caudoviricetes sp.]